MRVKKVQKYIWKSLVISKIVRNFRERRAGYEPSSLPG